MSTPTELEMIWFVIGIAVASAVFGVIVMLGMLI